MSGLEAFVAAQGMKMLGKLVQGQTQGKNLERRAKELKAQAGIEAALSQKKAEEIFNRGKELRSKQIARAQGGSTDTSVLATIGRTAQKSQRDALNEVYSGELSRSGLLNQAQVAEASADQERFGSIIGATSSVLDGYSSAYDRYSRNKRSGVRGSSYLHG